MEIMLIRHHLAEDEPTNYLIDGHICTVEDLRQEIERKMNLSCKFSLGFIHPHGQSLTELGVAEGSTVTVSDMSSLLVSFDEVEEDLNLGAMTGVSTHDAPLSGFAGIGSSQINVGVVAGMGTEDAPQGDLVGIGTSQMNFGVAQDAPQGNIAGIGTSQKTQMLAGTTSFKKISENVFSENIKWFEMHDMVRQVEYDSIDVYKKISTPKIKVRALFGHFTVDVKESAPANQPKPKWVAGIEVCVDPCGVLSELRSALEKEAVPLPPKFSFFNLSRTRLDENLTLYDNGIKDGDAVVLCWERDWKIKVLILDGEPIEVSVNPRSTVAELKKMLGLEGYKVVCKHTILDDASSLESEMDEDHFLEIC